MIGGIDEAGRGPVFGPLVVAGVAIDDPVRLADLGVKDSKRLSASRRERLARLIHDLDGIRVASVALAPEDLDARRGQKSLNAIEVELFRDVAVQLGVPRLVVDAADVDAARFGARIAAGTSMDVHSEHKADDRHAVVAAASIIAKVERDAAIEELKRLLERRIDRELGSGYPSDPKTQAFLATWYEEFGDVPPGARRSWKTVADLLAPRQAGLGAFE